MSKQLLELVLVLALAVAGTSAVQAQDAAALRSRHAALRDALASNAFQRPLVLESSERPSAFEESFASRACVVRTILLRCGICQSSELAWHNTGIRDVEEPGMESDCEGEDEVCPRLSRIRWPFGNLQSPAQ